MINERLFYFIHGFVTMWFLMAGWSRVFHKDAPRLKRMCGIILLYWGFLELKDLAFYATPVIRENLISNLLVLVDMTAIPIAFGFVAELIHTGWTSTKRVALYLAPYVLAMVLYVITESMWVFNVTYIYTTIYGISFLVYLVFAIKRYNKMLNENFSNIEFLHVGWLREVVILLVVSFIAWSISCYFSSWIVDSAYQILLLAMWSLILYHADRHQTPHEDSTLPSIPPLRLPSDGVLNQILVHKLELLLTENEIWKNPQLTLSDLAIEVGTNRTYLSNYLNNSLNTTFYDYINSFRLKAAIKKLEDPNSTATMVEIAETCGFNSISTFRRVFVRAMGCSLSEYRQSKQPSAN